MSEEISAGVRAQRHAFRRTLHKAMRLYAVIQAQPGIHFGDLARVVEMCPSVLKKTLPALESHGLLLYEDDAGRLYPFE